VSLNPDPSTVSLHEHMERRFTDLERLIDTRFEAAETATNAALEAAEVAVTKAEALATTRSTQQNEWRDTVNDLITTMMPRAEYALAHKSLVDKVNDVASCLDRGEGRSTGSNTVIAWVIAGLSAGVAVVTLLLN
jgi:hypothetical protein